MKRNMRKIIEQTTIDPKQDIRASEIQTLIQEYNWSNDILCLIDRAFVFGYALGSRAEKGKSKTRNQG